MNSDTNKDFAKELIKQYGVDRFYHSCRRTEDFHSNVLAVLPVLVYLHLNEDAEKHSCNEFFRSIGLKDCVWSPGISIEYANHIFTQGLNFREEMCRISYVFCKFYKEFGLRKYELPDHIHARMVLGEKNKWVVKYLQLLEEYKK